MATGFEEPALDRRSRPVPRIRLGKGPEDDPLSRTTAEERLAMMWELAVTAWAMSGRRSSDCPREEAPGRLAGREA